MLDAFKSFSGGKKVAQQQTTELETLIATAREERSAISAMLTALTTRSQKLTPVTKALEEVTEKTATIDAQLADITKRIAAIDARTQRDFPDRIHARCSSVNGEVLELDTPLHERVDRRKRRRKRSIPTRARLASVRGAPAGS